MILFFPLPTKEVGWDLPGDLNYWFAFAIAALIQMFSVATM